jgi:integrase
MEHINPHALRHTFATRCFEADIPPKTVQMLLGHANLEITMNLYVHVTDQKKVEDMQKLDKLLLDVI